MKEIGEVERDYSSRNSSFHSQEKILESFSKEELFHELKYMEYIYKEIREKSVKDYKKMIWKYTWDGISEMDKCLIDQFFLQYEGGNELILYRKTIDRFTQYYNSNHTDIYKNTSYIPFDINSTNIVDVIAQYIVLPNNIKRNIHCPIHRDNSPSLKIYSKNNSRYCFGCKKGWNAANFIADIENISMKEAFKKLMNLYK